MITVLEFISNPRQAIREAFRVSNGRVFFGMLNQKSFLAWKRKRTSKRVWREAYFYNLKEILRLLGKERGVKYKNVLYFPLINSSLFFDFRLKLERLVSKLNLPYGAFVGILAEG